MALRFTCSLFVAVVCVCAAPALADKACRLRQCDMPMTQSGSASQKSLCGCYKAKCTDEPDECKECAIKILGVCSGAPCGGPNQPACAPK